MRLAEPSVGKDEFQCELADLTVPQTIKMTLTSDGSQEATKHLLEATSSSENNEVVQRLWQHNQRRIESRNTAYAELVPQLLAVAQDKKSHWRYVLTASVC